MIFTYRTPRGTAFDKQERKIFPIMSNSTSTDSYRDRRRKQNFRSYDRRSEKPKNTARETIAPEEKKLKFSKYDHEADSKEMLSHRHRNNKPHVGKNGERHPVNRYKALEILKVIAGIVLLFAISWEIISGDHTNFSQIYLITQFVVCIIFLCDFFIRWGLAERRNRFFWTHLPYLLISIPWLNILDWSGVVLTHDWGLLVGLIPMLRAFLAMVIVVEWMVSEKNRMDRIFWAYIFTVVVFTYLSALVFFDYEAGVNTKLVGFGNALWWAWMNVTTVGAEIFAVTAIGKIVTVLLPSLGMMFFPIFTTYILNRYTGKKEDA